MMNQPAEGKCNMHSWSDKGPWSACCYTSDHAEAKCMWNKPSELTPYKADGFEISHAVFGAGKATAESAIKGWKNSSGHNAVMVNKGGWKNIKWKAVGIGIYQNYAVIWFGGLDDPLGEAEVCR